MAETFLKTYITGFDDEIGGGIPEGHTVLLAGIPGTLKSTIAYNMAYRNAKNDGAKVLYIVLDRNKDKFNAQVSKLGMDNAGGNIMLYDLGTIKTNLSHFKGLNWWEPFMVHVRELKSSFDFNILVLDSLQMLETIVRFTDAKSETHNIFKWLENDLRVTGILISEMSLDSGRYSRYDEEILVDGIIHLSTHETESGVERRIRCVKMSGVAHNNNYFRLVLRGSDLFTEKASGRHVPGLPVAPSPSSDSYSF
jgi:circadian clock protein KaiC